MIDQDKSKQELIEELAEMRRRVEVLETADTDRKQAEAALQASEERFHTVFDEGPMGVALVGSDSQIQHVNRRFCEMLGYSEDEVIALGIIGITHPDDYESDYQLGMSLLRGEIPFYTVEKRYVCKDKQGIWVRVTTSMMHDAAGKPSLVIGMIEDITERKQTEEALVEREARLLEVQEVASLGFYVLDIATGRFTTSSVLDQLFGVPADYGKTVDGWAGLLHPDDRHKMLDYLKKVVGEKKPFSREYRIVHYGDKQVRWVHGLGRLRFNADGQPVSMLGTIQDVTERKQAEEALQKAHGELERRVKKRTVELAKANEKLAYLASFPEKTPHPIIEVGLSGDIRYVNAAAQRLFPELREQGLNHPWLGDWEVMVRQFGEGQTETGIQEVAVADRWYQQVFCYLAQDQVVRIYGLDITDRKRAEEALRKEQRNLKHLLHSSDHERQLIAYDIHDGLAQQLAAAMMQFDAFDHLKEAKPQQAATAYHAAMTMLRQGHHEAHRLIAGLRPPILDESGVVEAIAHLVREEGREKGPKIENHSRVDFDRLDPTLENAVYRIAQEGLTNACQHSKSERISVSLLQHGDRLRIEIRDWGVGFDLKAVPRNHFGLEGIRQRARLLGGKCSIRSKVGKGTSITVELPVVQRDEEG